MNTTMNSTIKTARSIFLILFLFIALTSCSKPPYSPLPDDAVILAFGDSLTAGNGTTKENSYGGTGDDELYGEGGNDFLRNHKPTLTEQNLSEMIRIVQSKQIPLLLIGVPAKSLFSDSHELYHRVAEKHGVVLEDELIANQLRSPSLKSDAIHFNKEGYRKMAESIVELLKDKGAL